MPPSSLAECVLVLPERLVGVLVALARLQVALPVNGTTEKNSQRKKLWKLHELFRDCNMWIPHCGAKNRHARFHLKERLPRHS